MTNEIANALAARALVTRLLFPDTVEQRVADALAVRARVAAALA